MNDGSWEIKIPPQIYPDQVYNEVTEYLAEGIKRILQVYLITQLILHPIILISLSMLWGLINGIQIMAYLMLFNLSLPANLLTVLEVLYEVANFDLIPLDYITDFIEE